MFKNNPCQNALHVIHPYIFTGLPNLNSLNLSHNVLHTISDSAFTLPSLLTLDLSGNQLGIIQKSFFSSSPQLAEINLSRNGVSRLNNDNFGMLSRLSVLDLSHNSFVKIEDNVFVGMNVTHLDLGHNELRRPPKLQLQKLSFVKTLILDGNPFSVIEKGSLENIRAEFVSISGCPSLVGPLGSSSPWALPVASTVPFCSASRSGVGSSMLSMSCLRGSGLLPSV